MDRTVATQTDSDPLADHGKATKTEGAADDCRPGVPGRPAHVRVRMMNAGLGI